MMEMILYWGPTALTLIVFVGAARWIISRHAKLFAIQAENVKAQTASSLQLARAMERVATVLENRASQTHKTDL
jgi:hypothetical protein